MKTRELVILFAGTFDCVPIPADQEKEVEEQMLKWLSESMRSSNHLAQVGGHHFITTLLAFTSATK